MKTSLKISIGNLEHGWFPITVTTESDELLIDASDVPIDPIIQLVEATEKCLFNNFESEAWMHLEPNYYKWQFVPSGNIVNLTINYVEENYSVSSPDNKVEKSQLVLTWSGEKKALLLSVWRGVKEFASREKDYLKVVAFLESKVNEKQ